jgi:glutamate dehydrogenase
MDENAHKIPDILLQEIKKENESFEKLFLWLYQAMPPLFFEEVDPENIIMITHSLSGFPAEEYFSTIRIKKAAIVVCLDTPGVDLHILKNYSHYGIKNYQTYISNSPPPFPGIKDNVRIAQIFFTEAMECVEIPYPHEKKEELKKLVMTRNPLVTHQEFDRLVSSINIRFLRSLAVERLALAIDMYFRAQTRDNCQYEVRYNENFEKNGEPSMHIVLAWRNTPKHHFLYRLVQIVDRYNLVLKKVNAAYVNPYSKESIFLLSLGLHGLNGRPAWEMAEVADFLREFATVKYFVGQEAIVEKLGKPGIISSSTCNFLKASVNFIHQALVYLDSHQYTVEKIEEDLCRHPELTQELVQAFELKFNPDKKDYQKYLTTRERLLENINHLDTGHVDNDIRRKNVLKQALNMVHYCYKTNYYRLNYTALSFRLDPKYLEEIPFERAKHFPELPFAIFYIKGMHFFAFHIRFKDISRGGVRTVFPKLEEHLFSESNSVFLECYNLAYTQHKKNKDIPEGGAKGVIFLKTFTQLDSEAHILKQELEEAKIDEAIIESKLQVFKEEQQQEYLYQAQRAYIESLMTLINCKDDGSLKAKQVVDYWKKPEYIYLGPDENMHDKMITWIAEYSKRYGYKPGGAFITGKPKLGINHKEYGVTSLGVNVYMEAVLQYLGIDPYKEVFTVKMSGGPDGDVAGNQILNLFNYYPKTAKLIALTDVSGTIYDPEGLHLDEMAKLFIEQKPLSFYPKEKLHDGGFLLDPHVKRTESAFNQQSLYWKKEKGVLQKNWLSGSETNHLLRFNVHKTKADIFIPAGGRPRTLNEENVKDFLDEALKPTAKAIIEGANLYLTDQARRFLEEKGTLIIKDSSANKTGVICSSFEVLCGLTLHDELFLQEKQQIVAEVLERLRICAHKEALLLLCTYKKEGGFLTDISERLSRRINRYTDQILDHLEKVNLESNENPLLSKSFLRYCLPLLREKYKELLFSEIPSAHKKAIIACEIASNVVYERGLSWYPSIVDVLPMLLEEISPS